MNLFEHSFDETPVTLDLTRSRFHMPSQHKTTFYQGKLVPIYCKEVIPGDTFSMDMTAFIRMSTPVFPVMDNANLDVYWFFVPSRILWSHFKEFSGENTSAPWTQTTEYTIPQMRIQSSTTLPSYLCSYFGIPRRSWVDTSINALPFRAYYMIWNEWFRDQNLQYPINISLGDSTVSFGAVLANGFEFGKSLLPACRYPDYFSVALPQPQKGASVLLPLGSSAPVRTQNTLLPLDNRYTDGLKLSLSNGSDLPYSFGALGVNKTSDTKVGDLATSDSQSEALSGNGLGLLPRNLFADLSSATSATVNELRQAFALQRLFERDAIGGTRFREQLKAHFGTTLPDSTSQIPEYLGGFRQPIQMEQVVQTSSTDSVSPLATPSGVSVTTHTASQFTKSFIEPGYLMALAVVRVEHSYSQGLEPMWMRKRRFDFYYPALANIGNQPIYKYELYADDTNLSSEAVFGYKEAWAEYRYSKNLNTGLFSASVGGANPAGSLQPWIYGDVYSSSPALSDGWIREGTENIGNTIAVQNEPHFIADFYFKPDVYRPMPLYSVPGLIDHH